MYGHCLPEGKFVRVKAKKIAYSAPFEGLATRKTARRSVRPLNLVLGRK